MRRVEQAECDPGQTPEPGPAPAQIQISTTTDALRQLIMQDGDPARLLECYYWSQEPGLLEFVRAMLAGPADVRAILQTFFAAAVMRDQITASVDADGSLNLYSPEAATILTRFFRGYLSGSSGRHCC